MRKRIVSASSQSKLAQSHALHSLRPSIFCSCSYLNMRFTPIFAVSLLALGAVAAPAPATPTAKPGAIQTVGNLLGFLENALGVTGLTDTLDKTLGGGVVSNPGSASCVVPVS